MENAEQIKLFFAKQDLTVQLQDMLLKVYCAGYEKGYADGKDTGNAV